MIASSDTLPAEAAFADRACLADVAAYGACILARGHAGDHRDAHGYEFASRLWRGLEDDRTPASYTPDPFHRRTLERASRAAEADAAMRAGQVELLELRVEQLLTLGAERYATWRCGLCGACRIVLATDCCALCGAGR